MQLPTALVYFLDCQVEKINRNITEVLNLQFVLTSNKEFFFWPFKTISFIRSAPSRCWFIHNPLQFQLLQTLLMSDDLICQGRKGTDVKSKGPIALSVPVSLSGEWPEPWTDSAKWNAAIRTSAFTSFDKSMRWIALIFS